MSEDLFQSPGPEVFDGFRFFNVRQREGEENKHLFGATGPKASFDFGHGIHACPVCFWFPLPRILRSDFGVGSLLRWDGN